MGPWALAPRKTFTPPPPVFIMENSVGGGRVEEGENCRKCSLLKNIWESGNGNRFRASRKTSLLSIFPSDTAKQGNEVRPQNELPRPLRSLRLELNEEDFLIEVS